MFVNRKYTKGLAWLYMVMFVAWPCKALEYSTVILPEGNASGNASDYIAISRGHRDRPKFILSYKKNRKIVLPVIPIYIWCRRLRIFLHFGH